MEDEMDNRTNSEKLSEALHQLQNWVYDTTRFVPVVGYGDEGLAPLTPKLCPMAAGPHDEVSCVGSSGESRCLFCLGEVSPGVVVCAHD